MSRIHLFPLCALAVAICASSVRSEEAGYYAANSQFASYATVASMSQQTAEPEARLASFEKGGCDTGCGAAASCGCDGGGGCGGGDCGCGDSCWDWWTNPCRGLTGSAEVVWLRPQATDPNTNLGTEYHHGSRWTVGYLNECGRELRLRYFELGAQDGDSDFINIWTLDIEYAGRFELGSNWAGEFSLGARYADYHDQDDNNFVDSGGPVLGVYLKSDELFRSTNVFGNVRYSHQFGHDDDGDLGSFSVTEVQAGLEWTRQMCAGNAYLRLFAEAQNWAGDFDGSDEELGLIGAGVALGLTR
ncbi:MAG: hypothetical protein OES79_07405 [Planctomycetota bacterium]|nr:hypothetical protein [Planctomycetota bacterium]